MVLTLVIPTLVSRLLQGMANFCSKVYQMGNQKRGLVTQNFRLSNYTIHAKYIFSGRFQKSWMCRDGLKVLHVLIKLLRKSINRVYLFDR